MSVLVFTENWDGKFKKSSFELVSYASKIAEMLNTSTVALSIGNVTEDELKNLGKHGADKILSVTDERFNYLENQAYTSVIAQAAAKESASVLVFANNNMGKALAPRVAVKMNAGLGAGVDQLPKSTEPFTIHKKVYSGNAFGNVIIKTDVKVLTLMQNSFMIVENQKDGAVETFAPEVNEAHFKTKVKDVAKQTGQIILTDAEIVVSGGRGMKGAENWGAIEELAEVLGAATACSRPVSDEGWRPHNEHTGQTGKIIAPNLYIAAGISGAIQHIAGVSGTKCLVAINTDKDAPIFEVADYGIVGDALKVLPELVAGIKELKS
ncbi:MAG: electron transfer flavoprotein subunit alpha/FixB family protein [Salinivirgaceae bacterium]|nr:electron transfer flavoprotein subunit alpha/FixB family protein [Salinivirgaceae bacterium]